MMKFVTRGQHHPLYYTQQAKGNALTVKGHWITHLCMDIRVEKQKVYFSVLRSQQDFSALLVGTSSGFY